MRANAGGDRSWIAATAMMSVRINPKSKGRRVMLLKRVIASPRPPIGAYSRWADEVAAGQCISALPVKQARDFAESCGDSVCETEVAPGCSSRSMSTCPQLHRQHHLDLFAIRGGRYTATDDNPMPRVGRRFVGNRTDDFASVDLVGWRRMCVGP